MKLAATLSIFLCTLIASAQEADRSLHAYIRQYQDQSNIQFSYDTELLSSISLSPEQWETNGEVFLTSISNHLPLGIDTINQKYYVIKLIEANYILTIQDSVNNQIIPVELVSVLKNGIPLPGQVKNNNTIILPIKPNQKDTIQLYAIGYQTRVIPWETLIQTNTIKTSLPQTFIQLADVIIQDYLTRGINLNPANQSITIDVTALPLLPGETDGDLFASLAALPGISTPDNRPGNLFIRGSSTDQSYVMLDNIPIYSRGHYFGTISPYNPKVVDKVEVHRNGFHPRMGGRVGGAIEIQTDAVTELKPSGGVGVNTLFAMGYFKTPLANNKVGLSLGARRSFPSSFLSPKLNAITRVVYSGSAITSNASIDVRDVNVIFEDYQQGITINPNPRNHISISSLFTQSNIGFMLELPDQEPSPEETNNLNIGVSTSWKSTINEKVSSNLKLSYSSYELDFLSRDAVDNPPSPDLIGNYSINAIEDVSISEEINWKPFSGTHIDIGAEYRRQYNRFNYKGQARQSQVYTAEKDESATTLSPYVNLRFNYWEKLYLELGGRVNYYDLTNDIDFAPRAFASWYLSNSFTLKGSFGLYYQYLSQVKALEFSNGGFDNELWRLADGIDTRPIEGIQSMFGAIWNKSSWVVDVETYYKTAQNVNYYSHNRFNPTAYFYQNDQESYGIDFLVRKKINDNLESWLGYSYNRLSVSTDTATYSSSYSQPHNINTGITYHKNRWKISGGWRLASGLNGESLDLAQIISNVSSPSTAPNTNPLLSVNHRYPVVHFLDISASYTIPETDDRKWSSTFGLSLINVYNQKNLTDYVFRNKSDTEGGNNMNNRSQSPVPVERHAITFAPNLMVTIEW
ncbi:MAG: TonB-dependent receptor plug domain-containing protein [Marinoscillum sp.]